jgi:hypothetical protein
MHDACAGPKSRNVHVRDSELVVAYVIVRNSRAFYFGKCVDSTVDMSHVYHRKRTVAPGDS